MRKMILAAGSMAAAVASPAFSVETSDMIAARQHIFGVENVNPETGEMLGDQVVFSWLSASSFAGSINGRVIMMDTFLTRLEIERGRTPLTIHDLVNLNPEAILLGHGHNDHADNAAYISAMTDAVIYATEETCGTMQIDFERLSNDPRVQDNPEYALPPNADIECVSVTSTGSVPATEILNLPFLEPQACVTAFRHLHSNAVDPDPDFPPTPVEIIVDEREPYLFPEGIPLWPGRADPDYEPVDDRQFDNRTTRGVSIGIEV